MLGSVTADEADRNAVLDFVLRYFPAPVRLHHHAARRVPRQHRSRFGVAGTLALVWGALGVFGAISTAVNYAWGVEKHAQLLEAQAVFVPDADRRRADPADRALLLVSARRSWSARRWFAGVARRSFPGCWCCASFAIRYATTLLFILVVGLVYYFVPNAKVRFRDVWIGALVTGLLWKGALEGFSWYMRDMTRFTRVNGSIAAVVVFLVWVYVQAVILLYGVEFTAAYARLRRGRPEEVPAAPRRGLTAPIVRDAVNVGVAYSAVPGRAPG